MQTHFWENWSRHRRQSPFTRIQAPRQAWQTWCVNARRWPEEHWLDTAHCHLSISLRMHCADISKPWVLQQVKNPSVAESSLIQLQAELPAKEALDVRQWQCASLHILSVWAIEQ